MTDHRPHRVTAIYSIDDDGRTWLAHLEEDERVHTYGRTFLKAQASIREAAGLWFNVKEGELDVIDQLPPSYQEPIDKLLEARARLEANQAEVKQRTIDAIRMLQGWCGIVSERDIARMINLSHQRVHQLVAEAG